MSSGGESGLLLRRPPLRLPVKATVQVVGASTHERLYVVAKPLPGRAVSMDHEMPLRLVDEKDRTDLPINRLADRRA